MIMNILLTDMKHYFLIILLLVTIVMGGCTEELQLETSGTNGAGLDEGELTEAVVIARVGYDIYNGRNSGFQIYG